jgi:hypothetical protein
MMVVEIKAPKAVWLVEELSRRTGKSADDIVESALQAQFDRLQDEAEEAQRRAEIYALVNELRELVKKSPGLIRDPGEVLYGEDGLPK